MAPVGGVKREGEVGRRVDPRTKYSHLKIKPKGSNSPSQSSSLKRPHPDSPPTSSSPAPTSFKIPKLLQDSSVLEKPMDPRDLFKGVGATEAGYEEISGPFGMFKSNFFPHSQHAQGEAGQTLQSFGEITLSTAPSEDAKSSSKSTGKGSKEVETKKEMFHSDLETNSEDNTKPGDSSASSKPPVPSYLAHLDVGLGGDDLKIDSAFGSLPGKDEGGVASKESKESQARKLPSMFGLGF